MVLGTGIVGAGLWGRTHARAYLNHPDTKVVAVCDLDEEKCRTFAERYGIPKMYRSAEELAADPDVHAVSIATPDFAHKEPALAAIREKKSVLIEKPLATTVEDAIEIREAAKQAGVIGMVDFHNRFNPQFEKAKHHLIEGTMGSPRYIYMRHSNTTAVPLKMLAWSSKSSSLWFLGSHSTDLVRWLFADEVVEVYGACNSGVLRARGLDVPDVWSYTLRFVGGGIGTVENVWILPENLPSSSDFRSEIIGENGVYYTNLRAPEASELYTEASHRRFDYLSRLDSHDIASGFTLRSIQYFADCVLADRDPCITLDDGVANTKILCAIENSAASGVPVRL